MTDWIKQQLDEKASRQGMRERTGKPFIAKLRQQLLSDLERFKELVSWVTDVWITEYDRDWTQLRIQIRSESRIEHHLLVRLSFSNEGKLQTVYVRRSEQDEHPRSVSLTTDNWEITEVSRTILEPWFSDLGEKDGR